MYKRQPVSIEALIQENQKFLYQKNTVLNRLTLSLVSVFHPLLQNKDPDTLFLLSLIHIYLTRFLQKYSFLLSDSSVLGYYFHLYIDRKFFKDFIPQVVEFYDKNGQITDIRDEVATVYIQKSQTSIPFSKYLTEEYYYGDYTRMNTYPVSYTHLKLDL